MKEPAVTVGGREADSADSRPDPPKHWLAVGAVGIVAGLLLGIGLRGGTDPTAPGSTPGSVESPSTVVPTTTTTRPEPDRLATRVPGFIDDIVASYSTSVGTSAVAVWSGSARSPLAVGLPEGPYLADSYRTWLAAITRRRYSSGDVLWVGNQAYMEPVATGVLGAAWHANRPARLAWTEELNSESESLHRTLLRTGVFIAGLTTATRNVTVLPGDQAPVWWTQKGITVFNGARLLLLDVETGEAQSEILADGFVAATDQFAIVVQGDSTRLVDSSLGELQLLTIPSNCRAGSFAPTGTPGGPFVALACGVGEASQSLQVWAVEPGVETLLFETSGSGLVEPAWSPDGSFAVLPTIDPIRPSTEMTFYSPILDTSYTVTFPGLISALEVLTTR